MSDRNEQGRFVSLGRHPLCHPDRPYYARGLCANCWKKDWAGRHGYASQRHWDISHPGQAREHRRRSTKKWYERNQERILRRKRLARIRP